MSSNVSSPTFSRYGRDNQAAHRNRSIG
jgi:hypothetical protein